jgi:hypothetical protein
MGWSPNMEDLTKLTKLFPFGEKIPQFNVEQAFMQCQTDVNEHF